MFIVTKHDAFTNIHTHGWTWIAERKIENICLFVIFPVDCF